jgi:hypothetical protein
VFHRNIFSSYSGLKALLAQAYITSENQKRFRAMAQAVSRRSLKTEARVRVRVKPYEISHGKRGTSRGFLWVIRFYLLSVIPLWFSITTYNLGYKKQARWWPKFGDTVSSHQHEQQQTQKNNIVILIYMRTSDFTGHIFPPIFILIV